MKPGSGRNGIRNEPWRSLKPQTILGPVLVTDAGVAMDIYKVALAMLTGMKFITMITNEGIDNV